MISHTPRHLLATARALALLSILATLASGCDPASKQPSDASQTGGAAVVMQPVKLSDDEQAELQNYLAAGKAFGAAHDPGACISETIRRREAFDPKLPRERVTGNTSIFMSGCFKASAFPDTLCHSVPPQPKTREQMNALADWLKAQCLTRKAVDAQGQPTMACMDVYMFLAGMCFERNG